MLRQQGVQLPRIDESVLPCPKSPVSLTVGEQKTDALPAQTTDQNQQSQQGYYDGGQSGQSDNQFGGSWPFGFGFGG